MHHTTQLVVYKTRFLQSGWDSRCLDEAELAEAFDLPSYLEWNSDFPKTIVPIQVLRVVVDAVLEKIRPDTQKHPRLRQRVASQKQSMTEADPLQINVM